MLLPVTAGDVPHLDTVPGHLLKHGGGLSSEGQQPPPPLWVQSLLGFYIGKPTQFWVLEFSIAFNPCTAYCMTIANKILAGKHNLPQSPASTRHNIHSLTFPPGVLERAELIPARGMLSEASAVAGTATNAAYLSVLRGVDSAIR